MNLKDIINRQNPPVPWSEGDNIPWNDSDFSRRMLDIHLAQDNDMASRRLSIIDHHVNWINSELLGGKAANVLDLCCGPGLYLQRLTKLGHKCAGIDYSPASISYAKQKAEKASQKIDYSRQDVRLANFADNFDLVMMIFGEFNVFSKETAHKILKKSYDALSPGGQILFEVHTFDQVRGIGQAGPSWHSEEQGLFSDTPHLWLDESFWDEGNNVATKRFFIIDVLSGEVSRYAASYQAYTEEEYRRLLSECGFSNIRINPDFHTSDPDSNQGHVVFSGEKR